MTCKYGPMNIADNLTSKPYLAAMLAYLEIRISDTLGWPQGIDSTIP